MADRPYWGGRVAIGKRTLVARTCETCGLILGAKHFRRKRNAWSRICNSCTGKEARERYRSNIASNVDDRKNQNVSLESATRRRQPWTLRECDQIVEAIAAGLTYKEIAVLMNRTFFSIHQVISKYGLRDGWPEREQWIIGFPDAPKDV